MSDPEENGKQFHGIQIIQSETQIHGFRDTFARNSFCKALKMKTILLSRQASASLATRHYRDGISLSFLGCEGNIVDESQGPEPAVLRQGPPGGTPRG